MKSKFYQHLGEIPNPSNWDEEETKTEPGPYSCDYAIHQAPGEAMSLLSDPLSIAALLFALSPGADLPDLLHHTQLTQATYNDKLPQPQSQSPLSWAAGQAAAAQRGGACSPPCVQTGPAAELRTQLPAPSDQLSMVLTLLLPLLASLQMLPRPVSPQDPDPAPQLTVSPQQTVYVTGEAVTLTCSVSGTSIVSGVRFFRGDQEIQREELPSLQYSYTDSIQLSGVSGLRAVAYTCESWKTESGREIASERSQSISIAVTGPIPAPQLTVSPQQLVYTTGENVILTCSVARAPTISGVRFFKDNQNIQSKKLPSPRYRYTDSIQLSGVSRAQAGVYSCESWKTESGREIASERSQSISIAVADPDPAPQLTASPQQPVYITGEAVTLTCSATGAPTMSGVRFFRDNQKIQSKKLPSPRYIYIDSIQLSGVSRAQAGMYSCESWKTESGREIASERSQSISIAVTDPLPAPQLTVSPQQPVYVTGEAVTLTCSATGASTMSGIRLFRYNQIIHSMKLPSPRYSYTVSFRLSGVSGWQARVYSCESWKAVSGQEITSERSQHISITVTDPLPVPQLTKSPQQPVYITGEAVTLTCSAIGAPTVSRVRFFRDSWIIHSKELPSSQYKYSESIQLAGVSGLRAGKYSCESWKTVSGQEIASERSRPISIAVTELGSISDVTLTPYRHQFTRIPTAHVYGRGRCCSEVLGPPA
ncbi:peroxidasin homolog [Mauremys reevesii]|uniref:peroxidasin homolog n=1 Tax=Mauremys reevesii TaxID=260615 RepID=UPI00193FAA4B|nr:peroxidasin homolog [Mauremys reevesii]